jgi:hypothetical protein
LLLCSRSKRFEHCAKTESNLAMSDTVPGLERQVAAMPAQGIVSVAPSATAHAVLRPLGTGEVQIDSPFWSPRRQRNRDVSLWCGADELERSGSLPNLRIAAGRAIGEYRGHVFKDSDVYKWLEAVSWELGREPSERLSEVAARTIELLAAVQGDDGYLNSYCQVVDPAWRFSDLGMGHEMYCAGHLLQAAVAHARSVRDDSLLQIATRLADYLHSVFGPGKRVGVCGHPEIEMALVELYRLTGERRYLELAIEFIDRRGRGLLGPEPFGSQYFQDNEPVRDMHGVIGHAVRALYLGSGVADVYLETGDETLLAATVRQWDDMVATKTFLTGGVGSRERDEAFTSAYDMSPDHAYCETCAAIASIMWSWRLLLATGDVRYADLIERTLYNGFLAGSSLDGRAFFYVNPLHVRERHERAPWYEVACCPPNVMRILATLEHYLATTSDAGVQIHQYVQGAISAELPDGQRFGARVRTDYPWAGTVDISVTEAPERVLTLSLRVPGWCDGATVSINGEAADEHDRDGGQIHLTRAWAPGDTVVLELPMEPRITAPHPRIDAIRGTLAIERGPLVYCVEAADLPAGADIEGITIEPDASLTEARRPDLLDGVITLQLDAEMHDEQARVDGWPYAPADEPFRGAAGAPLELQAVPYYAWGNRGPGAMRVWLPAGTPPASAPADS